MKIAINGMGRIGRLLFRLLAEKKELELVAVNDLMSPENLIYLLKYDSIFGAYNEEISLVDNHLTTAGGNIKIYNTEDPSQLPWGDLNVDLVIECSGKFTSYLSVEAHLKAGAKKVLLSTTGDKSIPLIIRGFNDGALKKVQPIVSSGGCMTNCSVTILQPLLENFSVDSVLINVMHAYTSRQSLVDSANGNFRRGRASGASIIPVEIDLPDALHRLFPAFVDRIDATSTRVPILSGALADFFIVLKDEISPSKINTLYRDTASASLKNILHYNEDPIVSADVIGNPHSAVFDATLTRVVKNQVRIGAWFDNEFGFTNRLLEIIMAIHTVRLTSPELN